jgi:death-on-curing protein
MIELRDVLNMHNILIDRFGGARGIRDLGALESAMNRPFATFGDKDLYPTPQDKAAAILESILTNHPFLDGNKRTGYVLMRLILLNHGLDLAATQEDKYHMVISVSKGDIRFDEIRTWIHSRLQRKNKT